MRKIISLIISCLLLLSDSGVRRAVQAQEDIARVLSMSPTCGYPGDIVKIVLRSDFPQEDTKVTFTKITASIIAFQKNPNTDLQTITVAVPNTTSGLVEIHQKELKLSAGIFTILTRSKLIAPESTGSTSGGANQGSNPAPNNNPPSRRLPLPQPVFEPGLDLPVESPPSAASIIEKQKPPLIDPVVPENPPTFYGQEINSENQTILYIIDCSGSMGIDDFDGPNDVNGRATRIQRITRANEELGKSIDSLPSNFRFNVEAYDCVMQFWQKSVQPATKLNKISAKAWASSIYPSGGTGTGPAVAAGLSDRNVRYIILLTDGEPSCGAGPVDGYYTGSYFLVLEAHRIMIKQANTQKARIDVVGIAAYGSMKNFCVNVAGDNRGSYTDIH